MAHPKNESSTTSHLNVTTTSVHLPKDIENELTTGSIIGICLLITVVIIFVGLLIWFFRRKYTVGSWVRIKSHRKGSLASSHSHLDIHVDDEDTTEERSQRDSQLFSIIDIDDTGDSQSRGTIDDNYFYDEIFERSAFTDADTHKSIGELTSIPKEDELENILFKRLSANV